MNTKIEKATRIAKENTKYNEWGYAVISKDDEWREDNEWNRDYDEYDSVFTRPIELDEEATKRFFEIVERQSKQSNESKYDDYDMLIKRLESKVALNKLFNATDKKEGKEIIPDKRDWSVIELMFRKNIEDEKYLEVTYCNPNINLDILLEKLQTSYINENNVVLQEVAATEL